MSAWIIWPIFSSSVSDASILVTIASVFASTSPRLLATGHFDAWTGLGAAGEADIA